MLLQIPASLNKGLVMYSHQFQPHQCPLEQDPEIHSTSLFEQDGLLNGNFLYPNLDFDKELIVHNVFLSSYDKYAMNQYFDLGVIDGPQGCEVILCHKIGDQTSASYHLTMN